MKHKLAFPLLAFLCVSPSFAQRKDFEIPTMHAARGTRGALASGSEYADEAGDKAGNVRHERHASSLRVGRRGNGACAEQLHEEPEAEQKRELSGGECYWSERPE